MKYKYPKIGQIVTIIFLDHSQLFMANEKTKNDFIKEDFTRIITHGKVIKITKNYIYIASYYPETEYSAENGYNITGIVKNCIDEWS